MGGGGGLAIKLCFGCSSSLCHFPSIDVDLVVVWFSWVVPEQVSLACSTGRGVQSEVCGQELLV